MILATVIPNCMFEQARLALGMEEEDWTAFLREHGRVSCTDDLYIDAPEFVRASRLVIDALVARGFRTLRLLPVSFDYGFMLLRLGRTMCMSEALVHDLAVRHGHPADWPLLTLDGRVFQALVNHFLKLGCAVPELERHWMTDDRLALLRQLASHSVPAETFATMLRDLGGGVFRAEDLDEFGFDRMVVALEEFGRPGRARPRGPSISRLS